MAMGFPREGAQRPIVERPKLPPLPQLCVRPGTPRGTGGVDRGPAFGDIAHHNRPESWAKASCRSRRKSLFRPGSSCGKITGGTGVLHSPRPRSVLLAGRRRPTAAIGPAQTRPLTGGRGKMSGVVRRDRRSTGETDWESMFGWTLVSAGHWNSRSTSRYGNREDRRPPLLAHPAICLDRRHPWGGGKTGPTEAGNCRLLGPARSCGS